MQWLVENFIYTCCCMIFRNNFGVVELIINMQWTFILNIEKWFPIHISFLYSHSHTHTHILTHTHTVFWFSLLFLFPWKKVFKSWTNILVLLDQFSIWNSSANISYTWGVLGTHSFMKFQIIKGLLQRKWQGHKWILGDWRQNWESDI